MSLSSSLQIGRSGLQTHQAVLETTGNNLANVATPGYKRREARLDPAYTQQVQPGQSFGRGVHLTRVVRVVDEALETRLRSSVSQEGASAAGYELLSGLEAVRNELTEGDTSDQLNAYFDAWSQLSTNPQDAAQRELVVQTADRLAGHLAGTRSAYLDLLGRADAQLADAVGAADDLVTQLAELNADIADAESGSPTAHTLRDQRDLALERLSAFLPISTFEQPSGMVDVYVGSEPIVVGSTSRGLDLADEPYDQLDGSLPEGSTLGPGQLERFIVTGSDQTRLTLSTGELGARQGFRAGALRDAILELDTLAGQIAFETNVAHAEGQGLSLRNSMTSTLAVDDPSASLVDAGLPFTPRNGSFEVHVSGPDGSRRQTTRIDVRLGGAGADTSLSGLAAAIDAIDGVSASVDAEGFLTVTADGAARRVSFGSDTARVVAALGLGGFFEGTDASTLRVADDVAQTPALIAAGSGFRPGDNSVALRIAQLREQPLAGTEGLSLTGYWSRGVARLASDVAASDTQRQADAAVRENLETRRAAVSGVNADEETIDLLQSQRAYQASARFLTTVDEMLQTLLRI